VLEGEVAEAAEEIIRENGKERDIEIIEMAVNIDHVHIFVKYPPKYSVSWIAKRIKGRSSKLLRDRFPQLKEWCPGHLWAPGCYHGSVGQGWDVVEKYIPGQKSYDKIEAARGEGEKTGVMPVVMISEEKAKTHKTCFWT
jgi:putative transposase